jgi:hypothetical protein
VREVPPGNGDAQKLPVDRCLGGITFWYLEDSLILAERSVWEGMERESAKKPGR